MDDFLQRLKQRKLAHWAAAYLAAAWVLLQVIDLASDSYDWPKLVMHSAFGLLALGFVVMLVLAWYHGERGAQRVSGMELLIVALVLVVGGGVLWNFSRTAPKTVGAIAVASRLATSPPRARSPGAAQRKPGFAGLETVAKESSVAAPSSASRASAPIPAQPIPAKSVAVLPFENLSTSKDNAYFADGMQDLILTKLADIGDLKVISRTSTAKYASHPDDPKIIGQQLGVATILEGSVQKAGNQVLINVQLIDAKTDSHIWAQDYTRTLDNIFGVEGEVATQVAKSLNAKLSASEKHAVAKVPTHNKQALDTFLKGSYYLNHETATLNQMELQKGIKLLERATQLDPDFGDAFGALSLAYQHLGGHLPQAEAAAKRALALKPDDANGHRMMAYVLMYQSKYKQALVQAKEAVRLAPENATIENGLGNVYFAAGDLDGAAATYRRALSLDPQRNFIRANLGSVLMEQHRYAEALDVFRTATVHDPSSIRAATNLAQVQIVGWGNLTAAREALQGVMTPVATSGALSKAWYSLDFYGRDYPAALAVIQQAPQSTFEPPGDPLSLYEAQAYQAQGDKQRAHRAFTKARTTLEASIVKEPRNAELTANLSLTLVGLGHADDALATAQHAVRLAGSNAYQALLNLAVVEAWTGKTHSALKQLDELLDKPAGDVVSVSQLKLDPTWDPIRHDPRFQALLKKYGKPQTTSPASAVSAATP